ncbi:energy transducer TonB [Mucilaginibacter sp. OK098]|uniref:energy transducer TonB n=1 Tax=Mucilaginibacter sp. OK098 TaxID=1855297 RepID=UPI00092028D9|nr:energy transducer TonB [Mucilaginibacter sp. OK098]SHN31177.1 TonB family C-terminal domain-containing protein [Mucilaginibacter sp. OK098]
MKFLSTLIALLFTTLCFAQRQNVYFLKNNGKYVAVRDSADYIRVVREPDSASVMYNVFEFYLSGKRKLVGKSKSIDPPTFEGQCLGYYANGAKKSITNYKDGVKVGPEYEFYPSGKPYLVTEYIADGKLDSYFRNYIITANYDSLGTPLVENGKGHCKLYDSNFKYIEEEGNVSDGKRDGVWKGSSTKPQTSFTENYKNGELISGTATFADGATASYTKSRGTEPLFKGGIAGFVAYLGNNIQYPDYERSNNIQGEVVLSFVVEKDGSVTEVKVDESLSKGLDKEALRVVKKSPHWIPGTMFTRPVRVVYSVPVNFSLKD